jgi:hypothetical protein
MQNESSLLSQEKMVCTYCPNEQSITRTYLYKIFHKTLHHKKLPAIWDCAATVRL